MYDINTSSVKYLIDIKMRKLNTFGKKEKLISDLFLVDVDIVGT